jgi:hypothetical protein
VRARERARKGQGGVVDRSPEGVIFSSRVGGSASGRQTSSQEKLSTNYRSFIERLCFEKVV